MQYLIFILFYLGVNLFRIIPFIIIYAFSYFIYTILFVLIGYRKSVVINNLKQSFVNKSKKEIYKIAKNFYKHNLSAIFIESIKGFTMSSKQLKKRYVVTNPEILNDYHKQGKDVMALATHYCNWEWGIMAVNNQIKHQAAALYKPMTNKLIDKYAKHLREKNGMNMVSITDTREYFEAEKQNPVLYIMATDQNPSNIKKAYWVNFLNIKTACLHGAETYAKFNNLPIVFFDVQRVKRGYYEMTIKKLCDSPNEFPKGEITQKYMSMLEKSICRNPADWLWSHKRWKHKFEDYSSDKY